jgi:hypothetical protein
MVLGNSSRFTEGFTSFTPDDELMIANLKQAVSYSKEKVAIPDYSLNVKESTVNTVPEIANPKTNLPNKISNSSKMNMNSSNMNSSNMNSSKMNMNSSDMNMNSSDMNMNSSKMNMNSSNMNMNSINNKTSQSPSPIATNMMMNKPSPIDTNMMMNKPLPTATNMINTRPTMNIPSTTRGSISKFKDINRVMNNGDEDDSEDEDAILEEEDETNVFENSVEGKNKHSTTRGSHFTVEEGFHGSLEIQSRNLRNILLALLLSCIGYLVVYSMTNNLIPIDDISTQLKKFKRIIYAGLFFLITYVCLEIF